MRQISIGETNMQQILLPSGKTATLKDCKGRDLLNAQRKAKSPDEIMFALMAELVEIDNSIDVSSKSQKQFAMLFNPRPCVRGDM